MAHPGEQGYDLLAPASAARPAAWSIRFSLACAVLASFTSCIIGYDLGVMNGAAAFIREDAGISKLQAEFLSGLCLTVSSAVGAAASGSLADGLGRRWSLAVSATVLFVGMSAMSLAPSYAVLLLGRLVEGIGVGLGLVAAPLYIAEISPAQSRGRLMSFLEVFNNLGVLLGYMAAVLLSDPRYSLSWRMVLGVGAAMAAALSGAVVVLPESPRWLVKQGRVEEAEQVLVWTSRSKAQAGSSLAEIMEAATVSGRVPVQVEWSSKLPGISLLRRLPQIPSPGLRRMALAGLGLQILQQCVGLEAAVFFYLRALLSEGGILSSMGVFAAALGLGLCRIISTLVSGHWQDRAGRRPLLLFGGWGMAVSMAALAASFSVLAADSGAAEVTIPVELQASSGPGVVAVLSLVAVFAYVAFFSLGLGPISWTISAEVFPLAMRAQALGLAVAVNRLAGGFARSCFLGISGLVSASWVCLMFASMSVVVIVFVYCWVPETKGKSLEEIEALLQPKQVRKPSLRLNLDFKTTTGSEKLAPPAEVHEPVFSKRRALPGTAQGAFFKDLFSKTKSSRTRDVDEKESQS